MIKVQTKVIKGSGDKPISIDIYNNKQTNNQPIVIFCHGFKGFKNWGHFDIIAEQFALNNFVFVKFNFSHNGTSLDYPADFVDLESFGNNNFQMELDDLGLVIDDIYIHASLYHGKREEIYLIGHSRGGGIAILKTNEDKRIKKLSTWASVKDAADFFLLQDLDAWKNNGTIFTYNSRTKQDMPLNYQIYENYAANSERLNIPKAAAHISVPWLIVHGTNDTSVLPEAAKKLHQLNTSSELFLVENGDHTFGGKHPWSEKSLPDDANLVVNKTIQFFK